MGIPPFRLIIKIISEILGLAKLGLGTSLYRSDRYISSLPMAMSLLPQECACIN